MFNCNYLHFVILFVLNNNSRELAPARFRKRAYKSDKQKRMKFCKFSGSLILYLLPVIANSAEINNAQLIEYAGRIETSFLNHNPAFFTNSFNFQLFVKQFSDNSEKTEIKAFNDNYTAGLRLNFDPGIIIEAALADKSYMKFLGIKNRESGKSLLFQLISTAGIDYHEYMLDLSSEKPQVFDVYIYSNYCYLSTTIGNSYTEQFSAAFPEKSAYAENGLQANHLIEIRNNFSVLLSKNKYEKIGKRYSILPDNLQVDQQILLMAIKSASHFDQNLTSGLIDRYQKNFGNDNRIYFLPIEGSFINGDYATTLEYINKFSTEVLQDPFLNFYRGVLLKKTGNLQKAEWLFSKLTEELPQLQTGYFSLLDLYIETGRYAMAASLLNQIETGFGYYKTELAMYLHNFEKFTSSDAYMAWLNE